MIDWLALLSAVGLYLLVFLAAEWVDRPRRCRRWFGMGDQCRCSRYRGHHGDHRCGVHK